MIGRISVVCDVDIHAIFMDVFAFRLNVFRSWLSHSIIMFVHFCAIFHNVCLCHSVQTCGLGGMKPNTVILGWPYGWRQSEHNRTWRAFLETCRVCASSRMALVIPKGINFFPDSTEKVCVLLLQTTTLHFPALDSSYCEKAHTYIYSINTLEFILESAYIVFILWHTYWLCGLDCLLFLFLSPTLCFPFMSDCCCCCAATITTVFFTAGAISI